MTALLEGEDMQISRFPHIQKPIGDQPWIELITFVWGSIEWLLLWKVINVLCLLGIIYWPQVKLISCAGNEHESNNTCARFAWWLNHPGVSSTIIWNLLDIYTVYYMQKSTGTGGGVVVSTVTPEGVNVQGGPPFAHWHLKWPPTWTSMKRCKQEDDWLSKNN